jgi:hypothetical protein
MEFNITNHGSLIGIEPLSDAAHDRLLELCSPEGWQWLGNVLYVDARVAQPLVEALMKGPNHG